MNGLALSAAGGDHARATKGRGLFGLSLCAGAGGLDLGLHLAVPGYRTVCYVERESYAASTLVARMEDEALDCAPVWDDVTNFNGKAWRGIVDIIHGGYPCQPFSVAGRKLGDKDPRHLWPHIARIVREIKPPICFFENVGGHLRLGFEQVHDDLRSMGYRVKAGLFTAEEVGAPHKRERLFILAHREGFFGERGFAQGDLGWEPEIPAGGERRDVANSNSNGFAGSTSATPGKDDPQGRKKRPAHAKPCRNGSSTGGFSLHEAGSSEGNKRWTISDNKSAMAHATRQPKQRPTDQTDAIPVEGRTRTQSGDGGRHAHLADSSRLFGQKVERHEQDRDCRSLGDADNTRLEGWLGDGGCENQLPAWPPSPTQYDEWERVPADLKPAVCRMADGLAYRVDRLRLCGNGVVPLVAAYAFCTLATEAIERN